jgi:hypothetical protein
MERSTVGLILAFIAGYVIGARDGSEALDEVVDAARAVAQSQEFEDLVKVVRAHTGHVLVEIARRLDPATDEGEPMPMNTILARARDIVQRGSAAAGAAWTAGGEATESAS